MANLTLDQMLPVNLANHQVVLQDCLPTHLELEKVKEQETKVLCIGALCIDRAVMQKKNTVLVNLVLASIMGAHTSDNACELEKLGDIAEAKVEQAKIIKKSNTGVVFDNSSSQGEECTCQGTAWEILEILVLACILTFFL